VVLGPEQLPTVARALLKIIREVRTAANETLSELRASLEEPTTSTTRNLAPTSGPDAEPKSETHSTQAAATSQATNNLNAIYGSYYAKPEASASSDFANQEGELTEGSHSTSEALDQQRVDTAQYSYETLEPDSSAMQSRSKDSEPADPKHNAPSSSALAETSEDAPAAEQSNRADQESASRADYQVSQQQERTKAP